MSNTAFSHSFCLFGTARALCFPLLLYLLLAAVVVWSAAGGQTYPLRFDFTLTSENRGMLDEDVRRKWKVETAHFGLCGVWDNTTRGWERHGGGG